MKSNVPRPPAGLDRAGRQLWRAVLADFQLRPDELIVLAAAGKLADEIEEMQAMKSKMTALVPGSTGQLRVNPFFGELRGHRLGLARLLGQLALSDADGATAQLSRSQAGRRLVGVRWDRRLSRGA